MSFEHFFEKQCGRLLIILIKPVHEVTLTADSVSAAAFGLIEQFVGANDDIVIILVPLSHTQ